MWFQFHHRWLVGWVASACTATWMPPKASIDKASRFMIHFQAVIYSNFLIAVTEIRDLVCKS